MKLNVNKVFNTNFNAFFKPKQFRKLCTNVTSDVKNENTVKLTHDMNQNLVIRQDGKNDSIIDWNREMNAIKEIENESPLEPSENSLQNAPRPFVPTFNFAAYVNKSESLKKLVDLGVDLSKIEKRKGLPQFLLKLDFEKDMKDHILFLKDVGLPPETFGQFITKNPLIFKETIEDLHTRVYYLESKKFEMAQITEIIRRNPFWLMFPTKRIDRRLGYFQKNFELAGSEIRILSVKEPRLITYNMEHIRMSTFSIREEMGFEKMEVKELLLGKPKIWMIAQSHLLNRFDYLHRTMNISHEQLIQVPEVFLCREHRLKERHEFLNYLGRAQYDPRKKLYVCPKTLASVDEQTFVVKICESNMETYHQFLKTL